MLTWHLTMGAKILQNLKGLSVSISDKEYLLSLCSIFFLHFHDIVQIGRKMPVIPELGGQRQEDCHQFEVS